MKERRIRIPWRTISLVAILSLVSYVGFYFAIVDTQLPFRLPNFWWKDTEIQVSFVEINGERKVYPD